MPVKNTDPAAETFVELLRQHIEFLQEGEYEYQQLYIYTAGSDEPWVFDCGAELDIREAQGLLAAPGMVRPTSTAMRTMPEYVIRLNAIVGSQLVV